MWIWSRTPLADAVLDRVPVGKGRVRLVLIGVDSRVRGSVALDEPRQCRPVYALDNRSTHAARRPVLDTGDN